MPRASQKTKPSRGRARNSNRAPQAKAPVKRGKLPGSVGSGPRQGPERTAPAQDERVSEAQAREYFRGLLRFMGEDPTREGLLDTPDRVLRSYREHFSGYDEDPHQHLATTFTEVEGYDELVLVSDIEVFSHCEHHVVPFVGRAHVAYIPDGRVVGLSKLARVVDVFAKRLQVQEKLTAQIAGAIQEHLRPLGVAVVLQCQHFCMCYRGVRKSGSWTTTSKLHGIFLTDAAARMELLTLIGMHREISGAGHS